MYQCGDENVLRGVAECDLCVCPTSKSPVCVVLLYLSTALQMNLEHTFPYF